MVLRKGDVVTMALGGGGGYGAPANRPAALLQDDLSDGIVTPGLAARFAGAAR